MILDKNTRYSPFDPETRKTYGGLDQPKKTFNGYSIDKIVDFIYAMLEDDKDDKWIARQFYSIDCDPRFPSIAWVRIQHMTESDIKEFRNRIEASLDLY